MLNASGFHAAASSPSRENGAAPPSLPALEPALDGMHLKELFRVLRRNWALVLAATAGIFGIAAYLAFSALPMYQAHAVIRLADVRGALTGEFDDYSTQTALGRTTNPIASELEVLLGRAVLGEVVDREGLRLIVDPESHLRYDLLADVQVAANAPPRELRLQFGAKHFVVRSGADEMRVPYGVPAELAGLRFTLRAAPPVESADLWIVTSEMAIDYLAASLLVTPRGNTNAVSVRYSATDPFYAQRVVNAAVEVFRDFNARSARQQAQRRRAFLEEQLRKHQIELAQVQQEFGAFQAREQVYSSGTRLSAQEQDLVALAVRREELDADRRMYLSLLAALDTTVVAERSRVLGTLISAPGIASNPVVSQLYAQRAQYEAETDRLTTGALASTADHPDVQRLQSLLASTDSRLIAAVHSHVRALEARIAALDELRGRSAEQMRQLPETHAEELRLTQQLETLSRVGDKLAAELQDARMAEAVEMGQVEIVYLAPLPTEPTSRGPARKLALGLALGLIFGCVGAFTRETLDTSIRQREELENTLRLPGLALIPRLSSADPVIGRMRHGGMKGRRPTEHALSVAATEAYRMLRSNLVFAHAQQPLKRIMVTSAVDGEGKTTTASNLARVFAQQRTSVLLVDCDLHHPGVHREFGIPDAPGLTEILLDEVRLNHAIWPTAFEGLSVLPAGSVHLRRGIPLNEARLAAVLDQLTRDFELIILDTPSVLDVADAKAIGRMADGCILVVSAGQTERALAQQAQQQLALVGARVVGAVLNDPAGKARRFGRVAQPDYA